MKKLRFKKIFRFLKHRFYFITVKDQILYRIILKFSLNIWINDVSIKINKKINYLIFELFNDFIYILNTLKILFLILKNNLKKK